MTNYEEIIKLNGEVRKIKRQIDEFKEGAVIELYELEYSMDRIASMLFIAKIDVLNILHSNKIKIRKVGRKGK